jgi:hypothetical protein
VLSAMATSMPRFAVLSTGSWMAINGELPTWRLTAAAYDGVEFTETMGPEGVVYTGEAGYLAVEQNQNVRIWPGTVTHGHGGNKFEEYVWGLTLEGAFGWLPLIFRVEFEGMGWISPDELLDIEVILAATGQLPAETAAVAATGLLPAETAAVPAETAAVAAPGLTEEELVPGYEFHC